MNPNRQRMPLRWQDRALLLIAAVLVTLLLVRSQVALAQEPVTGEESWGLDLGNGQLATALNTDIRVSVHGLSAHVEVEQWFENRSAEWIEATYSYPLPHGAAVDRMQISAGDRLIEGVIEEKASARRQYQAARQSGQLASLVEQQHSNRFETRIANVAPGQLVSVQIGFLAPVDFSQGEYRFSIPMTWTPRWDSPQLERPNQQRLTDTSGDHRLAVEVALNSSVPLSHIESPFHDVDIHPTLNGYRVFLADPDERSDRVFTLTWAPAWTDQPQTSIAVEDAGDAVYAQLMLVPPYPQALEAQAREVVFIIDTSGSMEGASLQQAIGALREGLQHLGPDDRFNLVRFSSSSEQLFYESPTVNGASIQQAHEFLDGLQANGGTQMAPALSMALGLPEQPSLMRQVIFITDGSVGNEHELLLQIGEQLNQSRLFTVSIGSAPNGWFMRKAAEIGRGSHTHIGSSAQVSQRMNALWSLIRYPAIRNLCVDWNADAEFYPEIIPDLYAGEPLWLYARLQQIPEHILICGELDGEYWETEIHVSELASGQIHSDVQDSQIARLWARSRIQALQDSRIFGSEEQFVRQSVLETALDYGLLSPYTSMVAVDRTPARPTDVEWHRDDVPSLLPAGSARVNGFQATASGWSSQLLIHGLMALLCLLITGSMLLYQPPSRAAAGDRLPDPRPTV